MFQTAMWVLRGCNWLNWLIAAILTVLVGMILLAPDVMRAAIENGFPVRDAAARDAVWAWICGLAASVLPVALATHVILTRLVAILRKAAIGEALSVQNAHSLRIIAWALLAINVVDLMFGQLSIWASEISGEYFGWSPSLTGWFAVILLLLLARVFEEGAAMRDDLEGTV